MAAMQSLVLHLCLFAAVQVSVASDAKSDQGGAVSKVIHLLKDMAAQLQAEQDQDQQTYDQMGCWCETNDKAKTAAIDDAQKNIKKLEANIEEYTAAIQGLKQDITGLKADIQSNTEALNTATNIREGDRADFVADESSTKGSIEALKGAVGAMENRPASSMIQDSTHEDSSIEQDLEYDLAMDNRPDVFLTLSETKMHSSPVFGWRSKMHSSRIPNRNQKKLGSFLQQHSALRQPQSAEVLGVLKGMTDNFESNLESSQTEESRAQGGFTDMKNAKTEEISSSTQGLDLKEAEMAKTDNKLAEAKEALKDVNAALDADQKFLADLKDRCENMDSEFEERQQTRGEEIQGVSEAISILTSDDAQTQFSKATSFLQVSSTHSLRDLRQRASKVLLEAARQTRSAPLSALAVAMKSDVFTKIKGSIDKMLTQLQKEGKDDEKHKDYCVAELDENDKHTSEKHAKKDKLDAQIEDAQQVVENLAAEIEEAKNEISATQLQMKSASEVREKENKEYQVTMADQRATQEILVKALEKLKAVYGGLPGAATGPQCCSEEFSWDYQERRTT
jgi:chromosome segregation ATPase